MKFVLFTYEHYGLPVFKHLMDEGNDIFIGVVENYSDLGIPNDDSSDIYKEDDQIRKKEDNYQGLLRLQSHFEILEMLKDIPESEKDSYFIFFDDNCLYNICHEVLDMGFTHGLFPTEYYYNMEKNRIWSKNFVEEHFPGIKIAKAEEFDTIDQGIEFLNQQDGIFVLKSNGNMGRTIVPYGDNVDLAKALIINALQSEKDKYESKGYTLEQKIINCLEISPTLVFYNGKPIYSVVGFANKELGSGNIGIQKGSNQVLTISTSLDCNINKLAFPKVISELAKKQPGLAIYDMGMLYDGNDFYFTEFCGMRYGWDEIFSEITMRDDGSPFITNYFNDIINGKSPILNKFGVALRLFNIDGDAEHISESKSDLYLNWNSAVNNNFFIYRQKLNEMGNSIVNVGGKDMLGVVTGSSNNSINHAIDSLYEKVNQIYFEEIYYRPIFDFKSSEYNSSILNRVNKLSHFFGMEKENSSMSRAEAFLNRISRG